MKKWLYFLVDDQGRSYKKNGSVIQQVSQPTSLPNSPDGWQEISIGWERNMNRFGIIRNFSLPLGFVKAANDILRYVYLTGTVESKVFLLIKYLSVELTVSTFKMIYRFFYKGELDLSTIEVIDSKTTVNIMEGGLSKLLAANEGNTYEFDLSNDPEAVQIYADGYSTTTTGNLKFIPNEIDFPVGGVDFVVPVYLSSVEGFTDETVFFQTDFYADAPAGVAPESSFFFRKTNPALFNYQVKGSFKFSVTGDDSGFLFSVALLSHNRGSDWVTRRIWYSGDTYGTAFLNGEYEFFFDLDITVPSPLTEPENLHWVASIQGENGTLSIIDMSYTVKFIYRKAPTLVPGFTPSVMFRKLIGKVAAGEQFAQSDLLDLHPNLILTSGDALRGIEGAKIKTSLKDFFDSFNAWLNIGIGIEDKKIRIETKEHFFPSTGTTFHLGKAKNLKISFASDLFCNVIKTGYKTQEYDAAFGRFEFNNTSTFTTPITKVVKELNLISVYRTDPTGIELARINLEGKITTDDSADNDVFALNVDYANPNVDGSYNLLRPAYTTMLGIPAESKSSIFNIDTFSPKRIFKKHGNWLRSIFYGFEADKFIFQTTQKNRNLKTVLAGVTVDEDADETIGNLDAPLFKPYYLEFECQSPKTIVEMLDTDPNQPFSFEWEGETFKGFLIKAGIAPDSNKEQTIKLLCSPSNDMTKFI